MKPHLFLIPCVLCVLWSPAFAAEPQPLNAPWTADQVKTLRPATITPPGHTTDAKPGAPPSDAIVYFGGSDLSRFKRSGTVKDPEAAKLSGDDALWTIDDGYFEIKKGHGWIETREPIEGDTQWHIEWRTPDVIEGAGQDHNNPVRFRNIWARQLVVAPVPAPPEAIKAAEEKAKAAAEKAAKAKQAAPKPETLHGLPLVFSEDFEKGRARWETTDDKIWSLHELEDGNHVFGITDRKNSYEPVHRSPYHIALIKDLELADLAITFRVRSTMDTGNHRDCCVFFNHQDPQNFYYVHLGAKPDPNSGQIMIVKDAPRTPITTNEKLTPWTGEWHNVKLVRNAKKGTIEIYFDDMETPHMSATDKTFGKGRLGIGSFDDMNDFDDIKIYGR